MSQNKLPTVKDPLADIHNLTIVPEIIPERTDECDYLSDDVEEEITAKQIFGKKNEMKNVKIKQEPKPDKIKDNLPQSLQTEEEKELKEPKKRGKRGKDKKKRAKKVMSESQLIALKKGREKSLKKRQAKAKVKKPTAPIDIPKMHSPKKAEKLDYDTFSNYMDMYEETRSKKRHSNSKQPHPNKIIAERNRPMPPRSKPNVLPKAKKAFNWIGKNTSYAQHKVSTKSRWNYGI
jgi:hypothetical protein